MRGLFTKTRRDLWGLKGQILAVSIVMACGIMLMMMARNLHLSLNQTKVWYYQSFRLADGFVKVKKAPEVLKNRLAEISGIGELQTRVTQSTTLLIEGSSEPATGMIYSMEEGQTLNQIFVRVGELPFGKQQRGVVISESFAKANHLQVGARIEMIVYGKKISVVIVGLALSPEFVFEARPGETLPDHEHFAIVWMNRQYLDQLCEMRGAFNDVVFSLATQNSEEDILKSVDEVLKKYGGQGSYLRKNLASSSRLEDELKVLKALSMIYPLIFLSVAAFMVNSVLIRMIKLQRELIAQLKALGYRNYELGIHYAMYGGVIFLFGTGMGAFGGYHLGKNFLKLYHEFFRFPEVYYLYDWEGLVWAMLFTGSASLIGVGGVVAYAVKLNPAEGMRPDPPAFYQFSLAERLGLKWCMPKMVALAVRHIERKPWQTLFSAFGIALSLALTILPNALRDSIDYLLTYQWSMAQRQDAVLMFKNQKSEKVVYDLEHLCGMRVVEPFSVAQIKMHHGHWNRRLNLYGMKDERELNLFLDKNNNPIKLDRGGLAISKKLAEVLGVGVGDQIMVEMLQGKKRQLNLFVEYLVEDYTGLMAYTNFKVFQSLTGESRMYHGAYIRTDPLLWPDLFEEIKSIPEISVTVVKKDQLQAFRKSTGNNMNILTQLYITLSIIVAFGVVYNHTRITLSERQRDLSTMLVMGMKRLEIFVLLLTELLLVLMVAVPLGFLMGIGLIYLITNSLQTETVRLPILLNLSSFTMGILILLVASMSSFMIVMRSIGSMNHLDVLKARD